MIFAVQCFWFCTAAVCAACCMQILRCMMPLRAGWWRTAFLFIACLLSCSMVIFVGDLANLPPTILLFLAAIWVCCEGTGLQRITIGAEVLEVAPVADHHAAGDCSVSGTAAV